MYGHYAFFVSTQELAPQAGEECLSMTFSSGGNLLLELQHPAGSICYTMLSPDLAKAANWIMVMKCGQRMPVSPYASALLDSSNYWLCMRPNLPIFHTDILT